MEEVPEYLRRKRKKDRNRIARYRCGNEMRGGQYWREKMREDVECEGEKNMFHVLKEKTTKDILTIEEACKYYYCIIFTCYITFVTVLMQLLLSYRLS